jgi:tetratricopeptide (TPR) repeat protein
VRAHQKRLWVFRIVTAVAVPIILIVAAEMTLRLLGVGYDSNFTVACTVQDKKAACDNDHFTWQFFPPGAFRLPSSFAIPDEKPPTTFRIFVVGESAAQGVPEPSYAFSRYLEAMLRDRFPKLRFEVINASITATNSHVLLQAVRDLARRDGDLFILYIGNNEVVGPYGAGTALTSQRGNLTLIRAGIWLKSTRVGQLLSSIINKTSPGRTPRPWRGMEMFLDQQVPADAPTLTAVYDNFEDNLRDIVGTAKDSGAHVIVSTIGVNLKDSAPFSSLHHEGLSQPDLRAWDEKIREGEALENAGQNAQALERYEQAASIDDRYAELHYRIAQLAWKAGDFEKAKRSFARARDLDTLRFRADDRINGIIRSVGGKAGEGVELVDMANVFADLSVHGTPGDEIFFEHVHMNPHGNYLIAKSLYPRVVALLPNDAKQDAVNVDVPTEEEANRLLALTPHERNRIRETVIEWLSERPFTSRLNNDLAVKKLSQQMESESAPEANIGDYTWALEKDPEDRWLHFNFGRYLEKVDPAKAAAEFERALELLPTNYEVRQKLADALTMMGKYPGAIEQCQQLLRQMPYHAPAYLTLAFAQAQLGSLDESIASYRKAVELQPDYALDAYTNIGIMLLRQGKFEEAADSFNKAIAADVKKVRTTQLRDQLRYALQKSQEASEPNPTR